MTAADTGPPRGLLIDLDGVLYEGDRPIAGAAETAAWLTDRGIPHLFLTNTTSRPRRRLVEKLDGLGIAADEERILTPAVAARTWLARHQPGPTALFIPPATAEDFATLQVLPATAEAGAASVVVGDLGKAWTFEELNRAFRLLMTDPPPALVALGMTRYWRAEDGLRLDAGPFVKALEYAAGREPVVLGKPAPAFFETALGLLGPSPGRVIMVGDDIVGDVGGAQRAGLEGLLVRTGKFRAADLEGRIRPDHLLASIAALPAWWADQGG